MMSRTDTPALRKYIKVSGRYTLEVNGRESVVMCLREREGGERETPVTESP